VPAPARRKATTVPVKTSALRPARPTLLYLVTEDWYFWSHRLPMARAAKKAGFDVVVATRVDQHRERIEAEGFRVVPLHWQRRSISPTHALACIREIDAVYRRERPAIVHHVALKPILLGGLAAIAAGVPAVVNAVTGLGSAFVGRGLKSRIAGLAARPLLRIVLGRPNSLAVFQNSDDRDRLVGAGMLAADRARIIRGSGVDIARLKVQPEPAAPPIVVGCASRLLVNKGIGQLVEAQQRLRAEGHDVRLIVAGKPDPASPTSIPQTELDRWAALPGVELAGHVEDVRTVWARCHIAALPSLGGEGLPKSLLEAAACGRALVATDVPGCREVARAGENALLVPPGDAAALAGAIATLARDAELRARFAEASRRIVESDMTTERVGASTVELYRSLLAAATRRAAKAS